MGRVLTHPMLYVLITVIVVCTVVAGIVSQGPRELTTPVLMVLLTVTSATIGFMTPRRAT